jgi:galactokinase
MIEIIRSKFEELYSSKPLLVKAPGRINLIGEHTDYNDGYVLPAAINKGIYFAMKKNGTNESRITSYDFDESISFNVLDVGKASHHWSDYLKGVFYTLKENDIEVEGVDCVFGGDIPVGAGMSSSAALECGFLHALNDVFNLNLNKWQIALFGQQTENNYVGLQCGIMDQFASVFGRASHFMRLDCRNLEFEYISSHMEGYDIVLVNSMVKHSLASSEYNTRRRECNEGVEQLKKVNSQIKSLRDVDMETLLRVKDDIRPVVFDRCGYVIEENERVLKVTKNSTIIGMSSLKDFMLQSHYGLRDKYQVSCEELDFLVNATLEMSNVHGARMMGGGFGGCTINIVERNYIPEFKKAISSMYNQKFNKTPEIYQLQVSEGISTI